MSYVSITRLRLRSPRFVPGFAWRTWASMRQARRADGFLGGYVSNGGRLAFWTVTAWRDEAAMRAYRNAAAHGAAMRRLKDWCDEASIAHLERPGARVPDPGAALALMRERGRPSKVHRPSPAHAAGRIDLEGARPGAPVRMAPMSVE